MYQTNISLKALYQSQQTTFIQNFILILSRVYNEPIQRPGHSWLVSLIGRALHWYLRGQGFESHTNLNFFFQAFFFCSCKSCLYNRDDHPSFNSSLCSLDIWFSYIQNFNKNILWKTFRLTSFQNPQNTTCLTFLQVCALVPSFIFAVLFISSFNILSGYFFVLLNLVAALTVWILSDKIFIYWRSSFKTVYLQCKITDRSEGASPLSVREGVQLNFLKKRAASSLLIGQMMFIKHCRTKISRFLGYVMSRWGIQRLGISFAPISFVSCLSSQPGSCSYHSSWGWKNWPLVTTLHIASFIPLSLRGLQAIVYKICKIINNFERRWEKSLEF